MKTSLIQMAILLLALTPHAWADLTGTWSCDDGGTYYLRQAGRQLFWYAEADDAEPTWATVFSGRIYDRRIKGTWADVPKGRGKGSGDLELVVDEDENGLRKVKESGGYKGSQWRRQGRQTSRQGPLERLQPSDKDDCVRFDPSAIRVEQVNGRWKLIDKKGWLFDFGPDQPAANKALKVINHYRMDRLCVIGAAENPSFSYFLAKGGSPFGPMQGETCVAFDPERAAVSKIQGRWKITAGTRRLFDFGSQQSQASQALAIIRQHGFTQSCKAGRPSAHFTYLRR